jgi:hypothetical protein
VAPLEILGVICAALAIVNLVAGVVLAWRGRALSVLLCVNFLVLGGMVQLKLFG